MIRVSTLSKECWGSIDGTTFHYSDGSTDTGVLVKARVSVKGADGRYHWKDITE